MHDITEEHHLDQLRDDLQHMIIHDLRNPLTIIHTGLNLLVDNPALSAYDRRILDMSRSNSSRAVMLINAILDANQLEQGKIPIEASSVQIFEIVNEVIASIAPLAQIQSIIIKSELPDDLPSAWADERLMVRILQNLVDNAVKFSPKNGRVCVRATPIDDQLRISVSDEGPGIPPALQSNVFDKFAAGDNLRRGSGLGLAFCKLAIEAHGGKIWVDSSAEQGTTFSFSVPTHYNQTEEE
jgi:signal transduction histidine kinase